MLRTIRCPLLHFLAVHVSRFSDFSTPSISNQWVRTQHSLFSATLPAFDSTKVSIQNTGIGRWSCSRPSACANSWRMILSSALVAHLVSVWMQLRFIVGSPCDIRCACVPMKDQDPRRLLKPILMSPGERCSNTRLVYVLSQFMTLSTFCFWLSCPPR